MLTNAAKVLLKVSRPPRRPGESRDPLVRPLPILSRRARRWMRAVFGWGGSRLSPGRRGGRAKSLFLLVRIELFPGVLDLRDRLELDIGKSAVHLLDPAQIDVLDNVARLRIDRDRAARAFRVLPGLEKIHRFVGGELALCRLDHVEDRPMPSQPPTENMSGIAFSV